MSSSKCKVLIRISISKTSNKISTISIKDFLPSALTAAITVVTSLFPIDLLCRNVVPDQVIGLWSRIIPVSSMFQSLAPSLSKILCLIKIRRIASNYDFTTSRSIPWWRTAAVGSVFLNFRSGCRFRIPHHHLFHGFPPLNFSPYFSHTAQDISKIVSCPIVHPCISGYMHS